jgi:hypothetical protein
MKRVYKIQTSDGVLHDSQRDATRHAERRYGDALLSLGRDLANQKYTFVTDYIDANLDAFAALTDLKNDHLLDACDDQEA